MSALRPSVSPALRATLTAAVPTRLVRKLDQDPRTAETWAWDFGEDGRITVTSEGGNKVELRPDGGHLSAPSQVSCSCLLAPRCLHLLAVVIVLPVEADARAGDADTSPAGVAVPATIGGADEAAPAAPTPAQQDVARMALRVLAEVLSAGAQGSGLVLQGELLRSVHACRVDSLPRLSAALLSVQSGIRACREESAEFQLPDYAASLTEAISVAFGLSRAGPAGFADMAGLVGVARREYDEVGHLRLHGMFSEPVLTAGGYAGVVTWLLDTEGRCFTLPDVAPGGAERISNAYAGAARLGGGALTHRELGRSGLHVEGATASREGRLGAGQGVRAVKGGSSSWAAPPLAGVFAAPIQTQIGRAFEAQLAPPEARPPLASLLCFTATVAGLGEAAVLLDVDDGAGSQRRLEAVAGDHGADLPWRENLSLLGRAVGLRIRCVGRPMLERAPQITLLAVEAVEPRAGEPPFAGTSVPRLALPPEWAGHCNLGLDRLQGAYFSAASGGPVEPSNDRQEWPDDLLPFRRRHERLALGGRATIFPGAMGSIEREARYLETLLMPTGAAVLRGLGVAGLGRGSGAAERLAETYLAAGEYLELVQLHLQRAAWGEGAYRARQ